MIGRADRNTQVTPDSLEHRMLSPSDVARMWKVDIRTVYRRIHAGQLPATRAADGRLQIAAADVRAAISRKENHV